MARCASKFKDLSAQCCLDVHTLIRRRHRARIIIIDGIQHAPFRNPPEVNAQERGGLGVEVPPGIVKRGENFQNEDSLHISFFNFDSDPAKWDRPPWFAEINATGTRHEWDGWRSSHGNQNVKHARRFRRASYLESSKQTIFQKMYRVAGRMVLESPKIDGARSQIS